jgi:cellulose synthase/poly-beta-1,6-N-acetylglucosamine synthase-like glycosyltransferase
MMLALIVMSVLYCGAVLVVLFVLIKMQESFSQTRQSFISVIIAARNEEKRIEPTLKSLSGLKYPKEKYEIILVDDASQDHTADLIQGYVENNSNWYLIRISEKDKTLKGKKAALTKAIAKAQGEIILTTDADCIVTKDWLSEMAAQFNDNTIMVLGHSLILKQKGWLNRLLRFDNLFSAILTAAPTLIGFPMTSVGRNIAYKKSAYYNSGGYDSLSKYKSGDDVFLTELFRRKIKGQIKFCLSKKSFTYSKPPDSLREIFQQQVRKNSKIFKKSVPTVLLSLFLFLYHFLLFTFPINFLSSLQLWYLLLGVKLFFEFITLSLAAGKFSERSLIPVIPVMQIFYPVYVSILGILGMFQKYEWKK